MTDTSKIWVLFATPNDHNAGRDLRWWGNAKPSIDMVANLILNRPLNDLHDETIVAIAKIYSGSGARIDNVDYDLDHIGPGVCK